MRDFISFRFFLILGVFLALGAAGLMAADNGAPPPPGPQTNEIDPVMDGEPVHAEFFSDYKGRRVYFSSDASKQLFDFSPEDYVGNLPDIKKAMATAKSESNWVDAKTVATAEVKKPESHASEPFIDRAIAFFGHYHPAFVHFPIAMIIAAALAELLGLRWKNFPAEVISGFSLVIASLGALVACTSGWILASVEDFTPTEASLLVLHRWLGIATATSVLVALVLWRARRQHPDCEGTRLFYLVVVFGTALMVSIVGHLGATIVYGFDTLKF